MRILIRSFIVLPALVLALVAIPSVFMSAASGHALAAPEVGLSGDLNHMGRTGLGPGTVPDPTPSPIPPTPVMPTPPPPRPPRPPTPRPEPPWRPTPTATPTATPLPASSAATADTFTIMKVIGDRLSPTIYAFASNGWLYRSDKDGVGWNLVTMTPLVKNFIMNAANPNILYGGAGVNCRDALATIAPMYKSIDGGLTWAELASGINLRPVLTNPGDPNSVFAIDCSSIYLSSDGGQTWIAKPADPAQSIWRSYVPMDMAASSLAGNVQPAAPNWDQLYAIGNDRQNDSLVAFSGDMGDTWANITDPERAPQNAKVVTAHVVDGGRIWVVYAKGVRATSDYGVTWTFTNKGLTNLLKSEISPLNAITYGNNGMLYLGTNAGLYAKPDQGDTWVKVVTDSNGIPYAFNGATIIGLLLTESDPSQLWMNALVKNADGTWVEAVFTYPIQ